MHDYQIFKNIQKHISLTEAEKEHFSSLVREKVIEKKEIILRQGQNCKKLYFVASGSLRAFHLNHEGKEATIMFGLQDWWVTDMNAFVNQKTSLLSIEALEKSKIISLDFQQLEHLYISIPMFERFFRILFQNAYIREQQRVLHNISLPTEERYRQFLLKYPAIVEKVSQKQIASYLGVTPEFLSAVKKK